MVRVAPPSVRPVETRSLVAASVVSGNYSGEALISGNARFDSMKEAQDRLDEGRILDAGMSYEDVYADVLDEYRRGGITREESDRMAELRILVRDTAMDHAPGTSEAQIIATEYSRLTAAQGGSDPHTYASDFARDVAATLTQEDARNIVDLRLEEQDGMMYLRP